MRGATCTPCSRRTRADRLDPVAGGAHLVDEPADQRWRGSSSLAKKIEAAFRISLASLRSRDLPLQPLDLLQLLTGRAAALSGVDLGLQAPTCAASPARPRASAPTPGHAAHADAVLIQSIKGHPRSRARAARRDTCLGMICILRKKAKRHQTRDGSEMSPAGVGSRTVRGGAVLGARWERRGTARPCQTRSPLPSSPPATCGNDRYQRLHAPACSVRDQEAAGSSMADAATWCTDDSGGVGHRRCSLPGAAGRGGRGTGRISRRAASPGTWRHSATIP